MATYTTIADVTGKVELDPGTNNLTEYFDIRIIVNKDGEEIGRVARQKSSGSSNAEIRTFVLGEIRAIIEEDLVATSLSDLDARALSIEQTINLWEKVL